MDDRHPSPSELAPLVEYLWRLDQHIGAVVHYAGERRLTGYLACIADTHGRPAECAAWQANRDQHARHLAHHLQLIRALLVDLHRLAKRPER